MKNLGEIKCGETITIKKVVGNLKLKHRIMEMGLTKGTKIFVRKLAPLKDPIEIEIRGCSLVLRKNEAKSVLVI